jgi:hypothetical protein
MEYFMTNPLKPPFRLPGVNVLLMGPSGTGKTHAIGTLVDAGVETFYLALEAGMESLFGYWTDRGKSIPENLHWHQLAAPKASFTDMIATAKNVNLLSLEGLAKMSDPNRGKYNRFITLLEALNDFPDDRTGTKFGAVDSWDQTRALVVDGLTGICDCAMALVIGGKPVRSQADWQVAQDQAIKITRQLCDGINAHFILIAHIERETDQVLGGIKIMASALGKAMAPKLPALFSDVILAERKGSEWSWDTASMQADLKTRNLPIKSGLPPTFKTIVDKWMSRNNQEAE